MTVKLPTTLVPLCVLCTRFTDNKYKQRHNMLACNLNVTSRWGDLCYVLNSKDVALEHVLKLTIRGFHSRPMICRLPLVTNMPTRSLKLLFGLSTLCVLL